MDSGIKLVDLGSLALAAYADVGGTAIYLDALRKADLAERQAAEFASRWRVVVSDRHIGATA